MAAEACLGVCLHGIGDAGDDDSSARPVREVQPLTHLPPASIIKPLLMHPSYRCCEHCQTYCHVCLPECNQADKVLYSVTVSINNTTKSYAGLAWTAL